MLLPGFFDRFPQPTPPLGCPCNRSSGLIKSLSLEGRAAPPPWSPCLRRFVVCCGCSRDVTRPSYVKIGTKNNLKKRLPALLHAPHWLAPYRTTSSGKQMCHQNPIVMKNPPAPSNKLSPIVVAKGVRVIKWAIGISHLMPESGLSLS